MTKEDIKLYGDMFKDLGLTELKVSSKDSEFLLKREVTVVNTYNNVSSNQGIDNETVKHINVPSSNVVNNVTESDGNNTDVANSTGEIQVKGTDIVAPLVGVFYAAPSPDAKPYVKVGDKVNKGDVICVIEAMKMFNEIKSEVSGIITKICVDNGNIVEYGQRLMVVEE